MLGAKDAYFAFHDALNSVDFMNYVNKFSSESESAKLLEATLHPTIYYACKSAMVSFHKNGVKSKMVENEVTDMYMVRVSTRIISGENIAVAKIFIFTLFPLSKGRCKSK